MILPNCVFRAHTPSSDYCLDRCLLWQPPSGRFNSKPNLITWKCLHAWNQSLIVLFKDLQVYCHISTCTIFSRCILMSWAIFMMMGLIISTNLLRIFLVFWVSFLMWHLREMFCNNDILPWLFQFLACEVQQLEPQEGLFHPLLVSLHSSRCLSHL